MQLWDSQNCRQIESTSSMLSCGVDKFAFSRDGTKFITLNYRGVKAWDARALFHPHDSPAESSTDGVIAGLQVLAGSSEMRVVCAHENRDTYLIRTWTFADERDSGARISHAWNLSSKFLVLSPYYRDFGFYSDSHHLRHGNLGAKPCQQKKRGQRVERCILVERG